MDWQKVLLSEPEYVVGLDDRGRTVRYHRNGTVTVLEKADGS